MVKKKNDIKFYAQQAWAMIVLAVLIGAAIGFVVGNTTGDGTGEAYSLGRSNSKLTKTSLSPSKDKLRASKTYEVCDINQLIYSNEDPSGDVPPEAPGYFDLKSLEIYEAGDLLTFVLKVNGDPTGFPNDVITYFIKIWEGGNNPCETSIGIIYSGNDFKADINVFNGEDCRFITKKDWPPVHFIDNSFIFSVPTHYFESDELSIQYLATGTYYDESDMGEAKLLLTNPKLKPRLGLSNNDLKLEDFRFNIPTNYPVTLHIESLGEDITDQFAEEPTYYSSNPIVSVNGNRIMLFTEYLEMQVPASISAIYSIDECPLLIGSKLFFGDNFEGRYFDLIVPKEATIMDFIPEEPDYDFTFEENIERYSEVMLMDILVSYERELTQVALPELHPKTLVIHDSRERGALAAPPENIIVIAPYALLNPGFGFWIGTPGHEFGHIYTNSRSFAYALAEWWYPESLASIISTYSIDQMQQNLDSYPVTELGKDAVRVAPSHSCEYYRELPHNLRDSPICPLSNPRELRSLNRYRENPDFDLIKEDFGYGVEVIFDIMILSHNEYGESFTQNFFEIFSSENEDNPVFYTADTEDKRHTFFVAAISAASGEDRKEEFKELDFPIDDDYFDEVYPQLLEIIG